MSVGPGGPPLAVTAAIPDKLAKIGGELGFATSTDLDGSLQQAVDTFV